MALRGGDVCSWEGCSRTEDYEGLGTESLGREKIPAELRVPGKGCSVGLEYGLEQSLVCLEGEPRKD